MPTGQLVKTLRQRALEATFDHQVRAVTVIIDRGAVHKRCSEAEVGKTILKLLHENVSMHLSDPGDVDIVIADKPGGGVKEQT